MSDTAEVLLLDFLEWLAVRARGYDEVMEAWRTSCPRFPIWEEAKERRLVAREYEDGRCMIRATPSGVAHLKRYRRLVEVM